MKLDDLKAAWQHEIHQTVQVEGPSMRTIVNEVKRIDREVRCRDFWMIAALATGSVLYLIFGWLTQERLEWLSRLGVLLFVAATIVVSVTLIRARGVTRSDDWTLRSRIEWEIKKLEKQQTLMNRVGYWFLLPMLIANGISLLGGQHALVGFAPEASRVAVFVSCVLIYGFTYWLVRRETKRKWGPVLSRLRQLRADLLG